MLVPHHRPFPVVDLGGLTGVCGPEAIELVRFRVPTLILVWAAFWAIIDPCGLAIGQEPAPPVSIPIVVEAPGDLTSLWSRLVDPDFVLLDGKTYRELTKRSKRPPRDPADAVVDAVELSGEVVDDRAAMTMQIDVNLADSKPRWIPIRLDGIALGSARDGIRNLPIQFIPGTGWEIEVRGEGKHRIIVVFASSVRATSEGRRLDWVIPEVASAGVRLDVEGRVASATVGEGEPATIESIEGGRRRRLNARVSPRSRLVLDWKIDDRAEAKGPPLLAAQGQIALGISVGSITTRSSWELQALRGEVAVIQLQLDPKEELISLEVDGQKRDATNGQDGVLTIELTKPLNPVRPLKLNLTTRRRLPTLPATIDFHGHALLQARTQTGLLAVQPGDDLWVSTTLGPLIRQIDPRSELPDELRNQPGKLLGFVFTDQPFELKLQVESPSAVALVAQSTRVDIKDGLARVSSYANTTITQGRLFDAVFDLGPGLDFVKVGPAELIRSSRLAPLEGGGSRLFLQLTPLGHEAGTTRLTIEGEAAVPLEGEAAIGLFRAVQPLGREHRIAVVCGPEQQVTLAPNSTFEFDPFLSFEPSDWPRGVGFEDGQPPILGRAKKPTDRIELVFTPIPQKLKARSKIEVALRSEWIEVAQQIEVSSDFGEIRRLDLSADPQISATWTNEAGDPPSLVADPGAKSPRYSVNIIGGEDGSATLSLRYRISISPLARGSPGLDLVIPRVVVTNAVESATEFDVNIADGLVVESTENDSLRRADQGRVGPQWSGDHLIILRPSGTAPSLRINVAAPTLASLPSAVASRAWFQTEANKDIWRTIARYQLLSKRPTLSFRMPDRAKNLAVTVGGQVVTQLTLLTARPPSYRLDLPTELLGRGPILVEIDYRLLPADTSLDWVAPELIETTVQQSVWEIDLARSNVAVGQPTGWTDESPIDWGVFQGLVGRAARDDRAIRDWFGGSSPSDFRNRRSAQRLIFSRLDAPSPLRLFIVPHTLLVLVASALALAISLASLIGRFRPWIVAWLITGVGFLLSVTLDARLLVLIVESSLVGLVLGIVAFATQRIVERRRGPSYPEISTNHAPLLPATSTAEYVPVGSDDSTAIRTRPGSSRGKHVVSPSEPSATTPSPGDLP